MIIIKNNPVLSGQMAGRDVSRIDIYLRRIWYHDEHSLVLPALLAFSGLYRIATELRNRLYDLKFLNQVRAPCRVISVGNIAVGGTGKTPMIIMLANFLKARGVQPAVLSRGYGGSGREPVNVVSDGFQTLMDHREVGDEPVLIARSVEGVPVLTGPDRAQTGKVAVERFNADILLLDDGFQHRRLLRDLDMVLLDAIHPRGNGYLLPAGPLREPIESIGRAHIAVFTRAPQETEKLPEEETLRQIYPGISFFRACHRPKDILRGESRQVLPLDFLKGKRVFAFCGIAHPEAFLGTLKTLEVQTVAWRAFSDHYIYGREDLEDIRAMARNAAAEIILTTEKDGVRLTDFPDFFGDVFMLRIGMEITPSQEAFTAHILARLKS